MVAVALSFSRNEIIKRFINTQYFQFEDKKRSTERCSKFKVKKHVKCWRVFSLIRTQRSKRPLLACHTLCKCYLESSRHFVKNSVKLGN